MDLIKEGITTEGVEDLDKFLRDGMDLIKEGITTLSLLSSPPPLCWTEWT